METKIHPPLPTFEEFTTGMKNESKDLTEWIPVFLITLVDEYYPGSYGLE